MANASFQKTINRTLAPGQPGDRASNAPEVVTAYLAMTDLIPGTFAVNTDTIAGTVVATTANAPKRAGYSTGAATGIVAGLVTRDTTGVINNLTDSFQEFINAGLNVQIASKGEFKIYLAEIAGGSAVIGQQIMVADHQTGVPTLVADGTDGAEQWWLVEVQDAASGIGVISSWRRS